MPHMQKLLLIGQSPSRDGLSGFEGDSGKRLAAIIGISHPWLLEVTERVNLLDYWPGPMDVIVARVAKGDAFPREEAKAAAQAMTPSLKGRAVVMVGLAVAEAFGVPVDEPWAMWLPLDVASIVGAGRLAVIPHPSGVNRLWNDETLKKRARDFFWRALDIG